MRVDGTSPSTQAAAGGIPNNSCKERQYERIIGMPSGRFSDLPGLGIQTRRTGFARYFLWCLG